MRAFTAPLASSVTFGQNTAAFSTSGQIGPVGIPITGLPNASMANFGSQGSKGGPTAIPYMSGVCLQASFGTASATSAFPNPAGTLNLLGSNSLEKANLMAVVSSAQIAGPGMVLLRDSSPWYRYVDFSFVPNAAMGATSTGFVTVILNAKGISG